MRLALKLIRTLPDLHCQERGYSKCSWVKGKMILELSLEHYVTLEIQFTVQVVPIAAAPSVRAFIKVNTVL